MAKKGVYAVLVGCLFVNGLFTLDQPSYLLNSNLCIVNANAFIVGIGVAPMLFPLIAVVADVCFIADCPSGFQWNDTSILAIVSITLILSLIVLFFVDIVFSAMLHKTLQTIFQIRSSF